MLVFNYFQVKMLIWWEPKCIKTQIYLPVTQIQTSGGAWNRGNFQGSAKEGNISKCCFFPINHCLIPNARLLGYKPIASLATGTGQILLQTLEAPGNQSQMGYREESMPLTRFCPNAITYWNMLAPGSSRDSLLCPPALLPESSIIQGW